jgi:hypothetical protein
VSGAHAVLAPSSAARWVKCAGSVTLSILYPEGDDTPEAMEGTAAHWAFAEMLEGRLIDVGLVAPNGVVLTEEMIEGAEMYVDDIETTLGKPWMKYLQVEQRVDIPSVHAANWGTPDTYLFAHNPTTGAATLYLWDYKFGHGYVDVFENWQLIDYAAGVLDSLQIDGHADQYLDIVMRVVQPRSYHRDGPVREWRVKAADLRPYFNKLRAAAEAAMLPEAPCVVNPECKHCSARHVCEAFTGAAYRAADLATRSVPLELSPAAMGLELRMLKAAQATLDARITGLEQAAFSRLTRGERIPFFALEATVGRQVWSKPLPEVFALGAMFGKDLAKPAAITPKQAEKAGIDPALVALYSMTPAGSLKLVPDDGTTARKVFGK